MGDDRLGCFYRDDFGRVLATVIRLVGDFHVAEAAALASEAQVALSLPSLCERRFLECSLAEVTR